MWSAVQIYRASSLEGLFLRVLGGRSWPTRKGSGVERHRAAGKSAQPPLARPRSETGYSGSGPGAGVLALTALVAGIAVVSAFVAIWVSGGDHGTRVPIATRPHSRLAVASGGARPAVVPRSTHPPPPMPVSPVHATELEAEGHGLLQAGRYGAAVPVLERAVLATGETLGACLEPASSTCLTYAYALYDLGRAVRLGGEPQAAVPILERRLQIDNQRWIVSDELQLALQGIG